MDRETRASIFKTLIYSDIFDYPLRKEEVWRFLISGKSVQRKEFEEELNRVSGAKLVHLEGGDFYCLLGRGEIVKTRIKRLKESNKKIISAKKIVKILSLVPTVSFIGISGALARKNSDAKDDIDIFVIARNKSLWITRLMLVLLLILMGQYRWRGKKESHKVCLNMLIDEKVLEFENQDLYTAHEIIQLRPVFDRKNTYNKFLSANRWINKFLPNGIDIKSLRYKNTKRNLLNILISQYLSLFEPLAKLLQLLYMKKHRTKETAEDHFIAFHPFDYKSYVLKEYNKRLGGYEI